MESEPRVLWTDPKGKGTALWLYEGTGSVYIIDGHDGQWGYGPTQDGIIHLVAQLDAATAKLEDRNRRTLAALFVVEPMECGHPVECLPEHTAQEAREHPERIVCGWCVAVARARMEALEESADLCDTFAAQQGDFMSITEQEADRRNAYRVAAKGIRAMKEPR